MAAWLDCDRKVLLNEVLQHYRLTMSTVIAYAFVEAGTSSARRARVRDGPWRYSEYRLLVFLLTTDGARRLTVRLDFYRGRIHDRRRTNDRYEAVAAVQVRQADYDERTFELALINGATSFLRAVPFLKLLGKRSCGLRVGESANQEPLEGEV